MLWSELGLAIALSYEQYENGRGHEEEIWAPDRDYDWIPEVLSPVRL